MAVQMQESTPAGTFCPLCQRQNDCAIAAAGGRAVHCWCMDVVLGPDLQLRAARAGSACICRNCCDREEIPAIPHQSLSAS
jgi:hypothetical protein